MKIKIKNPIYGVPITYLGNHCIGQFEIIGLDRYVKENRYPNKRLFIKDKETYARLLIKQKWNIL